MVKEIYIYVEGGGNQQRTKKRLQTAFSEFFAELRSRARERTIHWSILACGSCDATLDRHKTRLRSDPEACVFLLVDSDGPVPKTASPWQYMEQNNPNWSKPKGSDDKHCHLMVQMTEAWFLADRERLQQFYGQGFHARALSKTGDVEAIPQGTLAKALKKATQKTQKGAYHKTKHAPLILKTIRLREVQKKASYCRRFVDIVKTEIDSDE